MYASFYPYCYIKATKKGCFIKNTHNGQYVIRKSNKLYKYFVDNNTLSYEINLEDAELLSLITEAASKECCFLTNGSTRPISPSINVNLVSSIKKDFTTLKIKNYDLMFSLVKQVNIHFVNNSIRLPHSTGYRILDFPEENKSVAVDYFIFERYNMYNLGIIILSGDVPLSVIDTICKKYPSKAITIRVSLNYLSVHLSIIDSIKRFANAKLQIVVEEEHNILDLSIPLKEKIDILVPISDIKNTDKFLTAGYSTIFFPLVTSENRDVILPEIRITYDDIVTSNISIDELHRRQVVNTHTYGSLTVRNNGDVYCMSDKVGNYLQNDFKCSLCDYLLSNNYWYLTRNHKKHCENCLFTEMCPPITIYESEGIIDHLCANVNEI